MLTYTTCEKGSIVLTNPQRTRRASWSSHASTKANTIYLAMLKKVKKNSRSACLCGSTQKCHGFFNYSADRLTNHNLLGQRSLSPESAQRVLTCFSSLFWFYGIKPRCFVVTDTFPKDICRFVQA